ncbi:MAG: dockerin type I domain-containing protein [Ruminococcus sp.]
MKKHTFFTRIAAGLLTTCFLCGSIPFAAVSADDTADTATESEPNNTAGTCNSLPLNQLVEGNLSEESDEDYYQFTTPSNGYFTIEIRHDTQEYDSTYWNIILSDESLNEIDSIYSSGSSFVDVSGKYAYPAGTYYLRIKDALRYSDTAYQIRINFTEADNWETESNDSMGTADILTDSTPRFGCISSTEDKDYYCLTVPENGYLNLTFKSDTQEYDSTYWKITLLDEMSNEQNLWYVYGNQLVTTTPKHGLAAGTYYILVEDALYCSNSDYSLTAITTPDANWENEPNNSLNTSNPMTLDNVYGGNLNTSSDVDCYQITLEEDTAAAILFTHSSTESVDSAISTWTLTLKDQSGTEICSYKATADVQESTSDALKLTKGTYYLIVEDALNYDGADYTVCLTTDVTTFLRGDVDEDDDVDADDAYLVLKAYASYSVSGDLGLEGNPLLAADVDENGNVNADDAYYILKYYATASVGGTADWDAIL